MSSSNPPTAVLCLAVLGPIGTGLAFAVYGGHAWSLWVMAGVVCCLATVLALIRNGRGRALPKLLLYTSALSLSVIPAASILVVAWVITGSWLASAAIAVVLGYLVFWIIGWAIQGHLAAGSPELSGETSDCDVTARTGPTFEANRLTFKPGAAPPRPRAKSR